MLQLVYRIEKKDPNTLLVRLEEKGVRRILYLDHLKMASGEADKAALSFLVQIHKKSPNVSRNLDTASFQQIEVPAALSNEAIRLAAKTGRLFWKETLVSFHPIAASLSWKGEKHSERSCTVEAFIEGEALACADVVFPGEPYWTLRKGVFRPFKTEIAWSWIEKCLKGPMLLEGVLKKKFLEEEPPIVWKKQEEKPLEVLPELVLQDSTGCFANLWMHYPTLGKVAFEDFNPSIQGKTRLKETENVWEKDLLETGFIRKIVGPTRYFCPSDKVRAALQFLLELGWNIYDSKKRRVVKQTGVNLSVEEREEKILISGSWQFGDKKASLSKSLSPLWLDLGSESVGLIDPQMMDSVLNVLQEAVSDGAHFVIPKQRISLLSSWEKEPNVSWSDSLKEKIFQMAQGASPAPPGSSFQGTLLPYQQKGLDWLSQIYRLGFSGLLADEMGLGKTVQVLAFFSQLRTNLPILIVAPTSLLFNWSRESARFIPDLPVYIHTGATRKTEVSDLQGQKLIVTSYAVLRQDEELLRSVQFEAVVLDESQAIKNAATQTARSAGQLQSKFRLCLSGTPIENRAEEFVSQFAFILPKLLSSSDSLEQIKRKSRPFFLRRRKVDVDLELPEKREQILWLEMTELQKEMYESYQSQMKNGLLRKVEKEGASSLRMEILEAILRLRQICSDPRLLGESFFGAKIEQLKEEIKELILEKRKILIYSQFTCLLSLIRKELEGTPLLYLDGSLSPEKRAEQVQLFQEDETYSVFLLSLKAGGAGLNLTAADTVILLDPWWNDAVEQQAIDRAHRMGQTKKILAKRYLTPDSIEEKMMHLKNKKRSVADLLLDSEGEASHWSADDLLELLV